VNGLRYLKEVNTFLFWITIDFKPYYGDEEQQLCILEKVKMLSIGVEYKFLLHIRVVNFNKVNIHISRGQSWTF